MIKYCKTKLCQLEESNLRPSLYEGDALPAELSWQKKKEMLIGDYNQHFLSATANVGLEPSTP